MAIHLASEGAKKIKTIICERLLDMHMFGLASALLEVLLSHPFSCLLFLDNHLLLLYAAICRCFGTSEIYLLFCCCVGEEKLCPQLKPSKRILPNQVIAILGTGV